MSETSYRPASPSPHAPSAETDPVLGALGHRVGRHDSVVNLRVHGGRGADDGLLRAIAERDAGEPDAGSGNARSGTIGQWAALAG